MDFKHNKTKYYFSTVLLALFGVCIGLTIVFLFFQNPFRFESIATTLIGYAIVITIVAGLDFLNSTDYGVKFTEKEMLAPSSYGLFSKQKSIELEKAFTIDRVWSEYPFLTYKVRQKKHSVMVSNRSLSKLKVEQIICELERHLTGR